MEKIKRNKGSIIIFLILTLLVVFWSLAPKYTVPFSSIKNSLASIGELFGLAGIVLFSINILLATRIPIIEKLFDNLNNVYKKHDFLGQLAFILLLFHPLFLIPRYASNLNDIFSFLFIGDSLAYNYGIIALWGMIILIVLTLFLRPKYNLWKITHKFFGVALFLGALHVYFIPGYVMDDLLLKGYVLFFAVLGIVAFFYKSVFGKYFIKKYIYSVDELRKLNDDIVEISLKPENIQLPFNSGQFVFISFKQKGLSSEKHPFSLVSSPKDMFLKISVKKLGDYTEKLESRLRRGTKAYIEGPFGTFSYLNSKNKNQIWIIGGIGITPFLSFITDLRDKDDYSVNLFYCVRNEQEAVYLDYLEEENKNNPQIKAVPFFSEEKGHISVEYLMDNFDTFFDNDFFISGPPRMINELSMDLLKAGVDKKRIHSEEFNL